MDDLRKTKSLDQFFPIALSLSDIRHIPNQVPGLLFSCMWIEGREAFSAGIWKYINFTEFPSAAWRDRPLNHLISSFV
jgi:hypothetical protein